MDMDISMDIHVNSVDMDMDMDMDIDMDMDMDMDMDNGYGCEISYPRQRCICSTQYYGDRGGTVSLRQFVYLPQETYCVELTELIQSSIKRWIVA